MGGFGSGTYSFMGWKVERIASWAGKWNNVK